MQAFYHWVYEGRVVVEALEEEMGNGSESEDSEANSTNADLYEEPTKWTNDVVDLTGGVADEAHHSIPTVKTCPGT